MVRKLKHITEIKSGLAVNSKNFAKKHYYMLYLQVKDFDSRGNIKDFVDIKKLKPEFHTEHILRQKDLLFAAKGTRNYAVKYCRTNIDAVASSSFLVLRLKPDYIYDEYLVWYLNGEKAQNYFRLVSKGVITPSVTRDDLGELEIHIPPIEIQKNIVTLSKYIKIEKELLKKIEEKKSKLIENLIYNKIKYASR